MKNEKSVGGCGTFGFYLKTFIKFLLSHIGLVSLVVGYTIIGAFTFERLEAEEEIKIKKNVTATRRKVADDLWLITENSPYFQEHLWAEKVRERLQQFEIDLIRLMKTDGWDGREDIETQQWTFAGALFYSIVVITTIGYGHITPKTPWGKVVTIFYAIPGVPLMMLCLANIGDSMARSFRFLYWKVFCYVCTKKPKRKKRSRSSRMSRRYPPSVHSGSQRIPRTTLSVKKAIPRSNYPAVYNTDLSFNSGYNENSEAYPQMGKLQPGNLSCEILPSKEEAGRGSIRSQAVSERTPTRSSHHSNKSEQLANGPNNLQMDENVRVLFNKYALDDDGHPFEEAPAVHNPKTVPNNGSVRKPLNFSRMNENGQMLNNMKELEKQNIKTPRSAPASLKGQPKPGHRNSPTSSSMPETDLYTRQISHNSYTPHGRYIGMEKELYYEDHYIVYEEDEYDEEENETIDKPVPIWLGVMLVVLYIFGGGFLFSEWEQWNFLDSVYFCFITLTTIGFGDFVPAAQEKKKNAELSIALCSLYLLFGIALLAMSFNLVQEEVINKVKKLGLSLGLIKKEDEDIDEPIEEEIVVGGIDERKF